MATTPDGYESISKSLPIYPFSLHGLHFLLTRHVYDHQIQHILPQHPPHPSGFATSNRLPGHLIPAYTIASEILLVHFNVTSCEFIRRLRRFLKFVATSSDDASTQVDFATSHQTKKSLSSWMIRIRVSACVLLLRRNTAKSVPNKQSGSTSTYCRLNAYFKSGSCA